MIPKLIHYCWLSNDPLPDGIKQCIKSWKTFLPDYEILLWDTNRFPLSNSKWVEQAFYARKYAFAADYIRCYALYHYGGIYLDSDVEVLKPFDDLLDLPYFWCFENSKGAIEAATMGCEPHLSIFKEMLDYYNARDFIRKGGGYDTITIPEILGKCLSKYSIKPILSISEFSNSDSVYCVLPKDYFSPKCNDGSFGYLTDRTYSIHHYSESWVPKWYKIVRKIVVKIGGQKLKTKIGVFYRALKSH